MKKTYQFAKTKVPEKIPLVDLEIKATKPAKYDLIQANSEKGISAYKKRINHKMYQSFYLISFITKDESKEGKEKEREYAKSWLPAAFSSDLNKCFGGELASLDDGPKTFGEVSVFEFPSREKYVDWMESEYHTKLAEEESGFVLNKFVAIGVPVYG